MTVSDLRTQTFDRPNSFGEIGVLARDRWDMSQSDVSEAHPASGAPPRFADFRAARPGTALAVPSSVTHGGNQ